jgi:hypothetical protein
MPKFNKKEATISQFLEINKGEWNAWMKKAHPDDQFSFSDWLSEMDSHTTRREWGIYRDESTDEWRYNETNSNWEGDDLCEGCGCYYKAEETETDFCKICNEDFD